MVIKSMRCGLWDVGIVSAGQVKMDGGAIFGVVPKPLWEQKISPDEKNRINLGMNCLVARNDDECIVVETGFGGKVSPKMRDIMGLVEDPGLVASLASLGIQREDVTRVVVTHLHQDHAGGCTTRKGDGYEPTFPNATYYVQKGEWEDAEHADAQTVNGYRFEDVMAPLKEAGCVTLLEGSTHICQGLEVVLTPGHTRHHQSVLLDTENEKFCYAGDLIPTSHHLRPIYILAYDLYPRETFVNKQALMTQGFVEDWVWIWSHDHEHPCGRLEKKENGDFKSIKLD